MGKFEARERILDRPSASSTPTTPLAFSTPTTEPDQPQCKEQDVPDAMKGSRQSCAGHSRSLSAAGPPRDDDVDWENHSN